MQFTNVGMLNTVSKRLTANTNPSSPPGILDAVGGVNGYYTTDTTMGGANISDLAKQQQFDAQLNDLLFGGSVDRRYMRMLNGDNTIDRQQQAVGVISNAPANPKQLEIQAMQQQLPKQAMLGTVNDTIPKPSSMPVFNPAKATAPVDSPIAPPPSPERIKESQVTEGFVGFCNVHSQGLSLLAGLLIAFVLYMLLQMYLIQKRLEMMMEFYAGPGHGKFPFPVQQ